VDNGEIGDSREIGVAKRNRAELTVMKWAFASRRRKAAHRRQAMAVHYFHCTNGIDAVFDQAGQDVGADDLLPLAAEQARHLMRGLPGYDGWAAWTVCVHDEFGHMVRIVSFRPPRSPGSTLPRPRRPIPARPAPGEALQACRRGGAEHPRPRLKSSRSPAVGKPRSGR
jgi:hypothetical protein